MSYSEPDIVSSSSTHRHHHHHHHNDRNSTKRSSAINRDTLHLVNDSDNHSNMSKKIKKFNQSLEKKKKQTEDLRGLRYNPKPPNSRSRRLKNGHSRHYIDEEAEMNENTYYSSDTASIYHENDDDTERYANTTVITTSNGNFTTIWTLNTTLVNSSSTAIISNNSSNSQLMFASNDDGIMDIANNLLNGVSSTGSGVNGAVGSGLGNADGSKDLHDGFIGNISSIGNSGTDIVEYYTSLMACMQGKSLVAPSYHS